MKRLISIILVVAGALAMASCEGLAGKISVCHENVCIAVDLPARAPATVTSGKVAKPVQPTSGNAEEAEAK